MIKALIFDIGGVVTFINFNELYANYGKRIGADPEKTAAFYKDRENFDRLLRGEVSYFELFIEKVGIEGPNVAELKRVWLEEALKIATANEELLKKIGEWRGKYKLIVLSNLTESRNMLDKKLGTYNHFDKVFLSFEEHLMKPDARFYQLALEHTRAKPDEAVFIDDNAGYVQGAQQLGIHGILFKNNEQLFKELTKLGVTT